MRIRREVSKFFNLHSLGISQFDGSHITNSLRLRISSDICGNINIFLKQFWLYFNLILSSDIQNLLYEKIGMFFLSMIFLGLENSLIF